MRVKGEEVTFVDPNGVPHSWRPEFHVSALTCEIGEGLTDQRLSQFQSDLDKFQAFKEMVDGGNAPNGMPRYLEPEYKSSVEVIPYATYQTLTAAQLQTKLHLRHLVITGLPQEQGPVNFDEAGLQELTHLDSTLPIQGKFQSSGQVSVANSDVHVDQSIPVEGDLAAQMRVGTLEHILEMARDPNGAIINGLSFPLPLSAIKRDKLCSDIEAWRLTEGLPFCTPKVSYPTGDMRWGLASTAGSRHWPHIDRNGLATYVELVTGKKLWILFRPNLDDEPDAGAYISVFLDDFDTSVAVKLWDAEAVVLTPGTRL